MRVLREALDGQVVLDEDGQEPYQIRLLVSVAMAGAAVQIGASDLALDALLAGQGRPLEPETIGHSDGMVAEALALGVPAVVTDMPIFREVAGDGALYAPGVDAAAFAAAVRELDDPARRDAVIAAGAVHIARFSWQRSADVLLDALAHFASELDGPLRPLREVL